MANRRMFCLDIVNSDAFLDMPCSAQNLYFHLAMRADDDGFIGNPNAITRLVNSSNEDLQLLKTKRFLLAFPNGVVVIKHWRMHNTIQKDRYKPTAYTQEFSQLTVKENNAYTDKKKHSDSMVSDCIQTVIETETQVRLGKNRLDYIPPIVPHGDEPVVKTEKDSFSESFNDFWKAYPKKVSKTSALKAWNKLKPDDNLVREILSALEQQKKTAQWQKDDGQFIPYPTTWLNGRRWEDDLSGQSNTNDSEHSYSLDDYKSLVNNFGGMK